MSLENLLGRPSRSATHLPRTTNPADPYSPPPVPNDVRRQQQRAAPTRTSRSAQRQQQSQERILSDIAQLEERRGSLPLAQLETNEALFFELIEAGNVDDVKNFLQAHQNLNINCINYMGLSALHIAIEKENESVVRLLFQRHDLNCKDAALHAVATGNVDFATIILDLIKAQNDAVERLGCADSPDYSPDITPIILAAQNGDYEMVRLLLARDHTIEHPHKPSCLCPDCKTIIREAGSSLSGIRLNAYRAICNPAYICQKTDDPFLYSFMLDSELKECAFLDKEFRTEYEELGKQVREFTVKLLSECRNPSDVETLLQVSWGYQTTSGMMDFPRLQLAIDYHQKEFVAHNVVQQVLSAHWLGEFRSWPRLSLFQKVLRMLLRVFLFPFICIALMVAPFAKPLAKYRSPLNRFLLNLASYLFFLLSVFLINHLDTGNFHRGPPATGFEAVVIIFVFGNIWSTIRRFWVEGPKRFFSAPWHWYDIFMQFLFVLTFVFWFISLVNLAIDHEHKREALDRKFWHKHDATLLHEGFFAIATVLAFGKLAYYCLQSSRLGPLQVSMGKMAIQIGYFLVLCFLINTAFSNPMTRMYAYYDGMKQTDKEGKERTQLSSFSTFSNSFTTLFWGMFGMSPAEAADIVVENLSDDLKDPQINSHDFTEGVGHALFATYELLMIIALVNTLIAILSNTFQTVVDNADVEFKFARTKLWVQFFDEASLLPSPFNLLPTLSTLNTCVTFCKALGNKIPGAKAKFSFTRCCYVEYEQEDDVDPIAYTDLMKNLVQRYFRSNEEKEE